jgi:hypothetical protein
VRQQQQQQKQQRRRKRQSLQAAAALVSTAMAATRCVCYPQLPNATTHLAKWPWWDQKHTHKHTPRSAAVAFTLRAPSGAKSKKRKA